MCTLMKMKETGSANGHKLKTAKWLFAIAVLFFVAKPFIGFALNPSNPITQETILIKSFTKRKHDYVENSSFDAKTIQKQLANPVNQLFLLFSCFLGILFPLIFKVGPNLTGCFVRNIKRSLLPPSNTWLRNGQLII